MADDQNGPRLGDEIDEPGGAEHLGAEPVPTITGPDSAPRALAPDETGPVHAGAMADAGRRHGGDPGRQGGSVSVMNLLATASLALVFGMVGAWAYGLLRDASAPPGQDLAGSVASSGATDDGAAAPGTAGRGSGDRPDGAPTGASGGETDAGTMAAPVRDERLEQLSGEVAQLREAIRSPSDPAPDSQLAELERRVAAMGERLDAIESGARQAEALAQQLQQRSERLDTMTDRLDRVELRLTSLGDPADAGSRPAGVGDPSGTTAGGLDGRAPEAGDGPGATTADGGPAGDGPGSATQRRVLRPGAGDGEAAEDAMAEGVRQFRDDDFAAAQDTFRGLLEQEPGDARAWYYAALARGKATGDWKGETERLVLRGVELERAGAPPRGEVDAAFDGLTERQGSEWLRYYRRRAAE